MSQYDNQDYYKVGGTSGGPTGPLHQFKRMVSQSRSVLDRDQERVLPGERPRAGLKPGGKGGKKPSVVDRLTRVSGTAGVSTRAKPTATLTEEELEDARRGQRAMREAEQEIPTTGYEDVASPTPSEAGPPASVEEREGRGDARFERDGAEAASGREEEERFGIPAGAEQVRPLDVPAWAMPALRPFRPMMRLIGGAARILDSPVRYTLDAMQQLGRLAEARPRRT